MKEDSTESKWVTCSRWVFKGENSQAKRSPTLKRKTLWRSEGIWMHLEAGRTSLCTSHKGVRVTGDWFDEESCTQAPNTCNHSQKNRFTLFPKMVISHRIPRRKLMIIFTWHEGFISRFVKIFDLSYESLQKCGGDRFSSYESVYGMLPENFTLLFLSNKFKEIQHKTLRRQHRMPQVIKPNRCW